MQVADAFGPILLAVTGITTAFNLADAGLDYFTPPPIEGVGIYGAPVHPGETVLVEWSLIKRTGCDGVNARVWDGADGFHLSEPLRPTGVSPGGERQIKASIPTEIPDTAPSGKLTLRIVGTYCPDTDPTPFTLGPVVFEVVE